MLSAAVAGTSSAWTDSVGMGPSCPARTDSRGAADAVPRPIRPGRGDRTPDDEQHDVRRTPAVPDRDHRRSGARGIVLVLARRGRPRDQARRRRQPVLAAGRADDARDRPDPARRRARGAPAALPGEGLERRPRRAGAGARRPLGARGADDRPTRGCRSCSWATRWVPAPPPTWPTTPRSAASSASRRGSRAGRRSTPWPGKVLHAAHGCSDRITSARQTQEYVERARAVGAEASFTDMGRVGHYMLRAVEPVERGRAGHGSSTSWAESPRVLPRAWQDRGMVDDVLSGPRTEPQPSLTRAGRRRPRAVVLMLHGGAEHNPEPVGPKSLSWLRSRVMMLQLQGGFRRRGLAVWLLRYRYVGWNAVRRRSLPRPRRPLGPRPGARDVRRRPGGPPRPLDGRPHRRRRGRRPVGARGGRGWRRGSRRASRCGALRGKALRAAHGRADRITSFEATADFVRRAVADRRRRDAHRHGRPRPLHGPRPPALEPLRAGRRPVPLA